MPTGHVRTGIVASFAVLFGLVQVICGCLSVAVGANEVAINPSAAHQMSEPDVHNMSENMTAAHEHSEHDHQADCSHCDNTVILMASVDANPTFYKLPSTQHNELLLRETTLPPVHPEFSVETGLRWRSPPRQYLSLDPVTLYTRSLT